MKLSTRARYALRMMVVIARQGTGGAAISLGEVSGRTRLSRRYLEQLAIALKNAGLIRGIAGKGGGYLLTRPPGEIALGEIVEAAIGPINIVVCVLRPETCIEAEFCECRWVYRTINDRILSVLQELTLDDLVDGPSNQALEEGLVRSSCPTIRNEAVSAFKEDE